MSPAPSVLTLSRFLDPAAFGLLLWAVLLAALRSPSPPSPPRLRAAWIASVALWVSAWLACTPATSLALLRAIEAAPVAVATLDDPALRARTALVVLSSSIAPAVPGDTPVERLDSASTARCIGAARVWRSLQTRAVIVTGRAPGPTPAATVEAMRDLLALHGVPRDRVALEPWALNTRQNALHAVRLGRRLGLDRFIVVTDASHLPRALREFRRVGVVALAAPVHHVGPRHGGLGDWIPAAWSLGTTHAALHEILGRLKP